MAAVFPGLITLINYTPLKRAGAVTAVGGV